MARSPSKTTPVASPAAAAPVPSMTAAQVLEATKAWDAARDAWKLTTEQLEAARGAYENLAVSGASDADLEIANDAVLAADIALGLATKAVYALVTTVSLPTHTPPSEANGGAGDLAGPALGTTFASRDGGATGLAVIAGLRRQARDLADDGELAEALAGLRQERVNLDGGFELLGKIAGDLDALIAELGGSGPVVEVTAKVDSRWRVGRHFGRTTVTIPVHEFAEGQLDALKADLLLTVVEK